MQCISVSLSSSIHTFGRLIVSLYVSNARLCELLKSYVMMHTSCREREASSIIIIMSEEVDDNCF